MRRRHTALFLLLVLLACPRAQAAVGQCTDAQANPPQPPLDAMGIVANLFFGVPLTSDPSAIHSAQQWGLTLGMRIDATGRIVCFSDVGKRHKSDVPNPPPGAALGATAYGRGQALLKDGKPIAMSNVIATREQKLPEHHLPLPVAPPEGWTIADARTACYGRCPIYRVVVHGDGRVDYNGIANVAVKGERSWYIPQSDVGRLVVALRDGDLWSMRDSYSASITDFPTETLTLQAGTQTHTIVDYAGKLAGMPTAVSDYEQLVYTLSGAKQRVEGGAPGR